MVQIEFLIEKTWDDQQIVDHKPVKIMLQKEDTDLVIRIEAPIFRSPHKPDHKIGEFFNLWDYEVVEVFFAAETGQYLELEFGPYGHYVVLLLEAPGKKVLKKGLELEYKAEINGNEWTGIARVPESYFPRKVNKLNAYAIHGDDRKYEALYPVPFQKYTGPDLYVYHI